AFRDLADEALSVLRERDDRRRDPSALSVRDDRRLATLHVGDGRVRGPQIDTDDLWHVRYSLFLAFAMDTSAGRMTRSWRRYAFWCSSMTVPSGWSDAMCAKSARSASFRLR